MDTLWYILASVGIVGLGGLSVTMMLKKGTGTGGPGTGVAGPVSIRQQSTRGKNQQASYERTCW